MTIFFNPFRNIDHPYIENLTISERQLKRAKVYESRWVWLSSLNPGGEIMEVGVAAGDFSESIIKKAMPEKLYLVDTYEQGDIQLANSARKPRYDIGENLDYIKNKFKDKKEVVILEGLSQDILPVLARGSHKFDMIYLDAMHTFEEVCTDIENSIPLLKRDGILAINDYVLRDENGENYGVVQAVNQFLYANPQWQVIGLALDNRMYMDIYLQKSYAPL
jgi:hypothetical protein